MGQRWFQQFKDEDICLQDKHYERPKKKFEDAKLQIVLDADSYQMQQQLASYRSIIYCIPPKPMQNIQKEGKWVPHESPDIGRLLQGMEEINSWNGLQRVMKSGSTTTIRGTKSWVSQSQPSTSQPKKNTTVRRHCCTSGETRKEQSTTSQNLVKWGRVT